MTITADTKTKIYKAIARGESNGRMQVWWPQLTVGAIAAFRANLTRNPKLAK